MDRLPLLYAVRHGETDWNAEARLQGQADTDMNRLGRDQAERNGRLLASLISDPQSFDYVASPLRRTVDTMNRIRSMMKLKSDGFRTDERLKEVHFGDWQGFTYAELEAREPGCTSIRESRKWDFLPPGTQAESYKSMAGRVGQWIDDLTGPTICVTHGGVIRILFHLIGNIPGEAAVERLIPQDRILRVQDGRLDWL